MTLSIQGKDIVSIKFGLVVCEKCRCVVKNLTTGAAPRRLLARRRGPQARTGDARGGSARVLTPRAHCSARLLFAEKAPPDAGSCPCVFITAGPSTKMFTWGGGGYGRTCAMRDDEPRPVWTSLHWEKKGSARGSVHWSGYA
jgi:hypothetical protein